MAEVSRDREQLISQHSRETEEMISRFTTERDELNAEITRTLRDHDEKLILTEQHKQQVRDNQSILVDPFTPTVAI